MELAMYGGSSYNGNVVSVAAEDIHRSYVNEADNERHCRDKLLQQLCYLGNGQITCTANDKLSALGTLLAIGKQQIGNVCSHMIGTMMSELNARKVHASSPYKQWVELPT